MTQATVIAIHQCQLYVLMIITISFFLSACISYWCEKPHFLTRPKNLGIKDFFFLWRTIPSCQSRRTQKDYFHFRRRPGIIKYCLFSCNPDTINYIYWISARLQTRTRGCRSMGSYQWNWEFLLGVIQKFQVLVFLTQVLACIEIICLFETTKNYTIGVKLPFDADVHEVCLYQSHIPCGCTFKEPYDCSNNVLLISDKWYNCGWHLLLIHVW